MPVERLPVPGRSRGACGEVSASSRSSSTDFPGPSQADPPPLSTHRSTAPPNGASVRRILFVLELEGFEVVQELSTSTFVYSIAFSPDTSKVAAATQAGSVSLWEIATGECLHTLRGHAGEATAVASPSGRLLASGGYGRAYLF